MITAKATSTTRLSKTFPETNMNAPDLTKRSPRSPRVRLGGYVILARMLDKGRAEIAGTQGEFHYNCPLDQHFTTFAGIDAEALKEQLKAGKGDGEILTWVEQNASHKRAAWEIQQWSTFQDHRGPDGDIGTLEFFTKLVGALATDRSDVNSWFAMLDLDDYLSYGGQG
jgi:hypothetical protein